MVSTSLGFTTLITTGWHPDGGWIHLWNVDGTVKDPQRDTYDQCFVLLALAWLWKATKWPDARVWAESTPTSLMTSVKVPLLRVDPLSVSGKAKDRTMKIVFALTPG